MKRKLIVIGITIAVGVASAWWFLRCYGISGLAEASVSIGEYESKDVALRAAIPKLASLLRICPCSDTYRILWRGQDPDENQRVDSRALLYNRKWKTLGYESDVYSGISGEVYIADEEEIRAVAETGGTLENFTEIEQGKNE